MGAGLQCRRCGAPLTSEAREGLCPRCLFLSLSVEEPAIGPNQPLLRQFGDFDLLEEIGRGGMGVVYKAWQRGLNRLVAVKMLAPGIEPSPEFIQRLRSEAAAAACLHHPHIVAIHEVGVQEKQHFFVMDLISGQSLATLAGSQPLPVRKAARYLQQIGEAVHHAHEHGILHRDLKPSNILINLEDQPHVSDFGLARRLDGDSQVTVTGQVLGSPPYMPPEQLAGDRGKLSRRTDVYALGAMLYQLLTGRPPFVAPDLGELMRLVLESDPVSPRLINPLVPRDLETICLHCLEKEPGKRYGTARELADELGRFLSDEPIRARPVGLPGRGWRWCRRNPRLALATSALVMVILVGLAGITWQWRQTEAERQMQRLRAYAADMRAADAAIEDNNLGQAAQLLERYLPQAGVEDLRGIEWRYLWQLCRSDDAGGFQYPAASQNNIDISPNGQWIITSALDGWVRIHDMEGKQVIRQPSGYDKGSLTTATVAFAPQGDLVAAATTTNILIWDTRQWELLRR